MFNFCISKIFCYIFLIISPRRINKYTHFYSPLKFNAEYIAQKKYLYMQLLVQLQFQEIVQFFPLPHLELLKEFQEHEKDILLAQDLIPQQLKFLGKEL